MPKKNNEITIRSSAADILLTLLPLEMKLKILKLNMKMKISG